MSEAPSSTQSGTITRQYTVEVTHSSTTHLVSGPQHVESTSPVAAVLIAPFSHRPDTTYTVSWPPTTAEAAGDSSTADITKITITDADIRDYITEQLASEAGEPVSTPTDYMFALYPLADRDDELSLEIAEELSDQYAGVWVRGTAPTAPYVIPVADAEYETVRELADALYELEQDYNQRYRGTVRITSEVQVTETEAPTDIVQSDAGLVWFVTEDTNHETHHYPLGLLETLTQASFGEPYKTSSEGQAMTAVRLIIVGEATTTTRLDTVPDIVESFTQIIHDEFNGYVRDDDIGLDITSVDVLQYHPFTEDDDHGYEPLRHRLLTSIQSLRDRVLTGLEFTA